MDRRTCRRPRQKRGCKRLPGASNSIRRPAHPSPPQPARQLGPACGPVNKARVNTERNRERVHGEKDETNGDADRVRMCASQGKQAREHQRHVCPLGIPIGSCYIYCKPVRHEQPAHTYSVSGCLHFVSTNIIKKHSCQTLSQDSLYTFFYQALRFHIEQWARNEANIFFLLGPD